MRTRIHAIAGLLAIAATSCAAHREQVEAPVCQAPPQPSFERAISDLGQSTAREPKPASKIAAPTLALDESKAKPAADFVAMPETQPTPASIAPSSEPQAKAEDPALAERRAVEALDRIAPLLRVTDTKRGKVITLSSDDLFEPGGATLSSDAHAKLDEIAAALRLQTQAGHSITVSGYTDSIGDARTNEDLSARRATAVRDYLVSKGVDASALHVEGMGQRRPVADNATPEGRAQNRRVEIAIEAPARVRW